MIVEVRRQFVASVVRRWVTGSRTVAMGSIQRRIRRYSLLKLYISDTIKKEEG
jgi:hypothetical protein